jgi:hypothetical protein
VVTSRFSRQREQAAEIPNLANRHCNGEKITPRGQAMRGQQPKPQFEIPVMHKAIAGRCHGEHGAAQWNDSPLSRIPLQ